MAKRKHKPKFSCYAHVKLKGTFLTDIIYSHTWDDVIYYRATFGVPRTSGYMDKIPLVMPRKVYELIYDRMQDGQKVFQLAGDLISYNSHDKFIPDKVHLNIKAEIKYIDYTDWECDSLNLVELQGYIVDKTNTRVTYNNKVITNTILAVNRYKFNKGSKRRHESSSYFPLLAWDRDACNLKKFSVGDKLYGKARFQSRSIKSGSSVTYELSLLNFSKLGD